MQTFRTKKTAELAEISKNRLQQWVFKGIIRPVKESPGHGMAGEFNVTNIIEIMLVRDFYVMGIPLKKGGRLARRISSKNRIGISMSSKRIKLLVDVSAYREEILNQI